MLPRPIHTHPHHNVTNSSTDTHTLSLFEWPMNVGVFPTNMAWKVKTMLELNNNNNNNNNRRRRSEADSSQKSHFSSQVCCSIMGFISGMIVGFAVGVGLIVAFARYESIRSKRRSALVIQIQPSFHFNRSLHISDKD